MIRTGIERIRISLLLLSFAFGSSLAAQTIGPGPGPAPEVCPGGLCKIDAVNCGLGTAPEQSANCPPGTYCFKKGNSCFGLAPFQIPIQGSIACINCPSGSSGGGVQPTP
jgi:hypothetical protein